MYDTEQQYFKNATAVICFFLQPSALFITVFEDEEEFSHAKFFVYINSRVDTHTEERIYLQLLP